MQKMFFDNVKMLYLTNENKNNELYISASK